VARPFKRRWPIWHEVASGLLSAPGDQIPQLRHHRRTLRSKVHAVRRPTPARNGRPAHLKHPLTLALEGVASGAQRLKVPRVVRINVYVSPQPTAQRSHMINLDSRRQKLVTAGTPVRIRMQQSQSRISPKSSSLRHPHRAHHHPHGPIHPCTRAAPHRTATHRNTARHHHHQPTEPPTVRRRPGTITIATTPESSSPSPRARHSPLPWEA
jgi:hypothetical protein